MLLEIEELTCNLPRTILKVSTALWIDFMLVAILHELVNFMVHDTNTLILQKDIHQIIVVNHIFS